MADIDVAVKSLRKVLDKKVSDKFEVGDVIRWTAAERFTYAAIKTAAGWFTTASNTNSFVSSYLSYEDLIEVLARSEVSDVAVSAGWMSLDGERIGDL